MIKMQENSRSRTRDSPDEDAERQYRRSRLRERLGTRPHVSTSYHEPRRTWTPSPSRARRQSRSERARNPSPEADRPSNERTRNVSTSHSNYNSLKDDRIERLERLVETLITDKITHGRDSYVMKSDCIPQFSPGDLTMTAQRCVDKIDQLVTINQ